MKSQLHKIIREADTKKVEQATTQPVVQQTYSPPPVTYTPPPKVVTQYVTPPQVEKEKIELTQHNYQKDARITVLEHEKAMLENAIRNLEVEIVNLKADKDALNIEKTDLTTTVRNQEREIITLKAENTTLKDNIANANKKVEDKELIITTMKNIVDDLKNDKVELKEENKDLKAKIVEHSLNVSVIEPHNDTAPQFLDSEIDINVSGGGGANNSFEEI